MNSAATQHHEGKVLRPESLVNWNKSHTIPWVQMMWNMLVLVSHLIVRKNHVENASGGVRSGTCYGGKVHHHRKHMGRHMIGGTVTGSDIHHRGTTVAIIS